MTTYFEGNLVLSIMGRNPSGIGYLPCIYDYKIHTVDNPSVESRFSYWVSLDTKNPTRFSYKLPKWESDKIYRQAITLREPIEKNLVRGILLWVDDAQEDFKVKRASRSVMITT